jgi:hypothetical protein
MQAGSGGWLGALGALEGHWLRFGVTAGMRSCPWSFPCTIGSQATTTTAPRTWPRLVHKMKE